MSQRPRLSEIRRQYSRDALDAASLGEDPLAALEKWLNEAIAAGEPEATAMTLSTSGKEGPTSRIVLLKEITTEGITFFTNYRSRKGQELASDPRAAALLFWPGMERQVRIEGDVTKSSSAISDAYFLERPAASRISAIISPQSEVIPGREWLENAYRDRAAGDTELLRPGHWGGFIVSPRRVEFWQGRPDRLHDRLLFTRKNQSGWTIQRLAP